MNKKLKLYQNLLLKKKFRGLNDLYFFNKFILEQDEKRRKFIVPHVHGEWSSWYHRSIHRVKMMLVPRSHFKTSFFTIGETIRQICINPNVRILLANATAENAKRFLSEIKDQLRKNDTLISLYGEFYKKDLKWNEDELVVRGRTAKLKESTITTVGVGGNLVSQHYDIIIFDDLMNLENSATKYQVDKVIDWFKRSFSLLEPDGRVFVIGTKWTDYDLYAYVQKNLKKADIFIRSCWDNGVYFPERFSKEKLNELKKLHGSYIFSCFYENNPIDEDLGIIKKSQLKYFSKAPKPLTIFIVSDPAISQSADADYSAIVAVGIDVKNNWYILDVVREKMTIYGFINELFRMFKKWRPQTMSLELISQSQGMIDVIRREEEKLGVYLPLKIIKSRPPVTKVQRIRSVLQPRFEQGKIYIRVEQVELENELLKFPHSANDDIIDCISDVAEIAFAPAGEQTEEVVVGIKRRMKNLFRKKVYFDEVLGENF